MSHGATIWNALAGPLRKIESNKTFGSQLKEAYWPITKTKYLDVTFQTDKPFIQFILVLNLTFILCIYFSCIYFLSSHLLMF